MNSTCPCFGTFHCFSFHFTSRCKPGAWRNWMLIPIGPDLARKAGPWMWPPKRVLTFGCDTSVSKETRGIQHSQRLVFWHRLNLAEHRWMVLHSSAVNYWSKFICDFLTLFWQFPFCWWLMVQMDCLYCYLIGSYCRFWTALSWCYGRFWVNVGSVSQFR